MSIDLKALARIGAESRLKALLVEIAEIQRMFPGLGTTRRGRPRAASDAQPKKTSRRRGRKKMSAAEKKAVSLRMKKYWAARRKQKSATTEKG
jgi:hypothetical protein